MAVSTVDKIRVEFQADTSKFKEDVKSAEQVAQQFVNDANKIGKKNPSIDMVLQPPGGSGSGAGGAKVPAPEKVAPIPKHLEREGEKVVQSFWDNVGTKFAKSGSVLDASGLSAWAEGLKMYGQSAVYAYGDLNALMKGLEAVSEKGEDMNAQIKELKEIAALPGLGFQDAVQGKINLRAIGMTSEMATKTLKVFGNAIATVGGNAQDMSGALLGFTQMWSKGSFNMGDFRQISDRIPQVRKMLEELYGTADTDKLNKMASAEEILTNLLNKMGEMKKVEGGVANDIENFEMSIEELRQSVGEVLAPTFQLFAETISGISEWFQDLSSGQKKFIVFTAAVAAGVIQLTAFAGRLSMSLIQLKFFTSGELSSKVSTDAENASLTEQNALLAQQCAEARASSLAMAQFSDAEIASATATNASNVSMGGQVTKLGLLKRAALNAKNAISALTSSMGVGGLALAGGAVAVTAGIALGATQLEKNKRAKYADTLELSGWEENRMSKLHLERAKKNTAEENKRQMAYFESVIAQQEKNKESGDESDIKEADYQIKSATLAKNAYEKIYDEQKKVEEEQKKLTQLAQEYAKVAYDIAGAKWKTYALKGGDSALAEYWQGYYSEAKQYQRELEKIKEDEKEGADVTYAKHLLSLEWQNSMIQLEKEYHENVIANREAEAEKQKQQMEERAEKLREETDWFAERLGRLKSWASECYNINKDYRQKVVDNAKDMYSELNGVFSQGQIALASSANVINNEALLTPQMLEMGKRKTDRDRWVEEYNNKVADQYLFGGRQEQYKSISDNIEKYLKALQDRQDDKFAQENNTTIKQIYGVLMKQAGMLEKQKGVVYAK